jgi:2-polyprenyl-6-methoxyphenol hydroxylase-like FAD-dependent oxidoreductase
MATAAAVAAIALSVTTSSPQLKVAVIGGSLGGLAAAHAFVRLGAQVKVFEKSSSSFEERGSSLGFVAVQLWEALTGRVMLRRGQRASRAQGAFFYGDLWSYLLDGLPNNTIQFGVNVSDLGDDIYNPTIGGETFDLAILAEGTWSALRTRYFGNDGPTYAGWQVYRFRVPLDKVPGWNSEGEFSNGFYSTILMRIAKNDGQDWIMGGSSCACPESDVKRPGIGLNRQVGGIELDEGTPDWFLPFYKEKFGQAANGEAYRAMEAAARFGKITANPQYEFSASKIVSGRIVLVGDSAHTAVPRTAAGAHTAILDGMGLLEAFAPAEGQWSPESIERALREYEPSAIHRARSLYNRSIEVSKPVLPPGWTREDSVKPITPSRVSSMSIMQLKAELLARRIPIAGLAEKSDLISVLLDHSFIKQSLNISRNVPCYASMTMSI